MAIIKLNPNYVEAGDIKQTGKYLFDVQDGTPAIELVVWLEKSKANDKHPEGKPWIILPKNNNTNRKYFSEDLFIETNVDGVVEVEVKTTPPRVLGASGVKQEIVKYLSDEESAEYTELVENAIDSFKKAKDKTKSKKIEDMSVEELQAYIDALKTGNKMSTVDGPKVFLDMFSDEDYNRYNELLAIAATNKANAPKSARQPLSPEEKDKRKIKRISKEISKAEELLQAMLARQETVE